MATLKVYVDHEAGTLNVWFDDPEKETVCEETGDEIILIKDEDGNVIGFEKLNYSSGKIEEEGVDYSVA